MECQRENCGNAASRTLFRPVQGKVKDRLTGKRIWNEEIQVCEECFEPAIKDYPYEVFARGNA